MEGRNQREMEDIAKRVQNVVSEMLESMKLGQLNQTVKETMGVALDEAREQIEQYKDKLENIRWRRKNIVGNTENFKKPLEIRINWKGKVSGVLFTVFGSIGTGIFGMLALVLLIVTLVSLPGPVGWYLTGLSGIFAVGFGGMLWKGILQNGRIGRLKQYVAELKQRGRTYCKVEDLSRSCGKSLGFVKKDLQKIIRMGMLPDARMDEQNSWLMLDEETYRQYELSQQSQLQRQEEEKRRESKEESALDIAIRQGEEYIKILDKLHESMPKEPVREKLLRLDAILERLFETLKKHPEQLDELEKFMEYYLPTTVKLVSTYQEFAFVEFPGDNIKGAKIEIEQTLDTINEAFEKLLDDMYEDTAFDVITDASVLQTMLAREGMSKSDFPRD